MTQEAEQITAICIGQAGQELDRGSETIARNHPLASTLSAICGMMLFKQHSLQLSMNIVSIYDKLMFWIRSVEYRDTPPKGMVVINVADFEAAVEEFKKIRLEPGWAVYFWQRKVQVVDHIAIVPEQDKKKLNLYNAELLHGTPPPIGKSYGPLAKGKDYSGIRLCTLHEFTRENPTHYSRIAVGPPPGISDKQLKRAGEIARKVGDTGLLLDKPAFYSLNLINPFLFIKSINYKTYSKVKFGIPWLVAKKQLGSFRMWRPIYCGALVGNIWKLGGVKYVPKAKVLCFSGYQSSAFYKYAREKGSLRYLVTWGEELPLKY